MTKQYLQQYLWYAQEQKRLESRIAAVCEEMEGIRSIIVSDMPKGGGRDNERLEKLIDLKQDLINEYHEQIKQGHIVMTNIETALHTIRNPKIRSVISMRFLDGYSFRSIAENMQMSERNVYRLCCIGIYILEKQDS